MKHRGLLPSLYRSSLALLTDLYELTMAAAHLRESTEQRPATFSLFVRRLPPAHPVRQPPGPDAGEGGAALRVGAAASAQSGSVRSTSSALTPAM